MSTVAYRTDTLLSVENIGLAFGAKTILRDISFKIDDLRRESCVTGQIVALLGPSGVGKSVLLKILAGLLQPTTGSVRLTSQGRAVRPGEVGMVMQRNPLFRDKTVLENLMIASRQHGNSAADAKAKSLELLTVLQMEDSRGLYPAELSGGMRQRAATAQQLLCSDYFLLMDEPFAALDPINVKRVCELIAAVAGRDELATVIVVTHDVKAALAIADTLHLIGREPGRPGAVIRKTLDLVEVDLCWHPELIGTKRFLDVEQEILQEFLTL